MAEIKAKILFVDDDNFLRKVYQAELEEKGYEVLLAADGQEGLEKAQISDPDLIILDMIMPQKNGFEVLTELQNNPATKNIPVIIAYLTHSLFFTDIIVNNIINGIVLMGFLEGYK